MASATPSASDTIPGTSPGLLPSMPQVVGVYGVSGCGKTYLLNKLKESLGQEDFAFYDGSAMIASVTDGGLDAFKALDEEKKKRARNDAIRRIREECKRDGKVGIVAGHYMLWDEEKNKVGEVICTQGDLNTYTHILYLEVPGDVIRKQRIKDKDRTRPLVTEANLTKWQRKEIKKLKISCRENDILFSVVARDRAEEGLKKLVQDFRTHSEDYNGTLVNDRLDKIISDIGKPQTMLVFDADRTLIAEDTGAKFWELVSRKYPQLNFATDPMKELFSSDMGYSYTAFRQAALIYEETIRQRIFEEICRDVALETQIHTELLAFLQRAKHVGVIVVTCGIRRVWQHVIESHKLSNVKIIGGSVLDDGYVVTPDIKKSVVSRLKDTYGAYVWAFGDSEMDLKMLRQADKGVVVVGDANKRSQTMDAKLAKAIDDDGLQVCQLLLPGHVTHRLDTFKLPIIKLGKPEIDHILARRLRFVDATDKPGTKLPMTSMRDASNEGPRLREMHRLAGWYLAIEYLSKLIKVDAYDIKHVQGSTTTGYRLAREKETLIVPLMRGGEPMAFGVNDAFPLAGFLHAKSPEDITSQYLIGQATIILVDSVINSGKSIVEFVQHIRSMDKTIRIVVVTGVIQAGSVKEGGLIVTELREDRNLDIVALRKSTNKYTGKGTTDTGHRLFNTTRLD